MGHSGSVPGAILAEDLSVALEHLRSSVQSEMVNEQANESKREQEDSENYVSIDKRAKPLIELLEAAIAQNVDVMWDQS